MDPAHFVTVACDNQATLVQILAWAGGIMPLASVAAWLTARWDVLPSWAQSFVQVIAGNILHAALGAPKTTLKGDAA